jgi:hypothetical protein
MARSTEQMNPLHQIYEDFLATTREAIPENRRNELCGPFLLEPPQAFSDCRERIMVFGQQTDGWDGCDELLASADGIGKAREHYKGFDYANGRRLSPFWQFFRQVAAGLDIDRRALLWTNVIKFEHHGPEKRCGPVLWTDLAEPTFRAQAGIISREIDAFGVNTCLFLTGPDFDEAIARVFPGATFRQLSPEFSARQLAAVDLGPGRPRAFRTYHPNYMQRQKLSGRTLDLILHALTLSRRRDG